MQQTTTISVEEFVATTSVGNWIAMRGVLLRKHKLSGLAGFNIKSACQHGITFTLWARSAVTPSKRRADRSRFHRANELNIPLTGLVIQKRGLEGFPIFVLKAVQPVKVGRAGRSPDTVGQLCTLIEIRRRYASEMIAMNQAEQKFWEGVNASRVAAEKQAALLQSLLHHLLPSIFEDVDTNDSK